jgi:selenocysteine lyase/cysteine desulfurase
VNLESHFAPFRANILGIDQHFESPYGRRQIVYADWTASGRMFGPIEKMMSGEIAPFVGNTHSEFSVTGTTMTRAYHEALRIIKAHVNAAADDAIICYGSGMTGVVNKFQRILGLRVHEKFRSGLSLSENERPVVFTTHMEHHSNHTSWIESVAEVRVIRATVDGLVDLAHLAALLNEYRGHKMKIAAVTSCSNVTGIFTPYHAIAGLMHRAGWIVLCRLRRERALYRDGHAPGGPARRASGCDLFLAPQIPRRARHEWRTGVQQETLRQPRAR